MENRSIAWVIILSVVTLGIYDFYWLYITRKELVAKGQEVWPVFILLLPTLIGFVIFGFMLANLLTLYDSTSEQSFTGTTTSSDTPDAHTVIFVLSMLLDALLFVVIGSIWAYKYCKAAEAVTKGRLDFTTTYLLCILLYFFGFWFIWPAIVQDAFNRVGNTTTPEAPQAPYAPNRASV